MDGEITIGLNRRRFLQTTTVAAGFGSLTVGTVSGKESASLGDVHFVETGIEYNADIPQSDGYIVPTFEDDELRGYSIDSEEKRLELNQFATPNVRTAFRQNNTVLKSERYRPFSAQDSGTNNVYSLTTKLTSDYRSVESLSVAQEYRHPIVNVSPRNNEVDVSVSGKRKTVTPEHEEQIHLQGRTVEVVAERQVDKDASGIPPESRADTFWEEFSKAITVKPTVKVRNWGTLDVFDSQQLE